MINRGERRHLLHCAELYHKLGYNVGLARGKTLLEPFEPSGGVNKLRSQSIHTSANWDSISIILDGIVCVDLDSENVNISEELPTTWKEKTRRGWHYFYRLDDGEGYRCRVNYLPNVDLLVKHNPTRRNSYGEVIGSMWYGHALVSPSAGYVRVHPNENEMMSREGLPLSPEWVLRALRGR